MYKQLLFLFLLVPYTHSFSAPIKRDAARKYIHTLVDALIDTRTLSHWERETIKHSIADTLTSNALSNALYELFGGEQIFDNYAIMRGTYKELKNIIVQHAQDRVSKITYDQRMQRDIVHAIEHEVSVLLDRSQELGYGALSTYFGYSLDEKMNAYRNRFTYQAPRPSAPPAYDDEPYYEEPGPAQIYTSDECMVCYDDLGQNNRIYLSPCGHDMCKHCAQTWFLQQDKDTCPKCRALVYKVYLRKMLRR